MEIMDIFSILSTLKSTMSTTMEVYKNEISGIRTGRVSPSLLNSVVVKAYGNNMHINQVASITVQDGRILMVEVWDSDNVDAVNKAILASNLGLTPSLAGNTLRIAIPPLSQERRQELVRVVAECAERCRVALRNIRQNHIAMAKKFAKDSGISEDVLHKVIEELNNATKDYDKNVGIISDNRTTEILRGE